MAVLGLIAATAIASAVLPRTVPLLGNLFTTPLGRTVALASLVAVPYDWVMNDDDSFDALDVGAVLALALGARWAVAAAGVPKGSLPVVGRYL